MLDYISCKWILTLTGDNDMGLSYIKDGLFSVILRLLVALSGFVVVAFGAGAGGRLPAWELTR